MTESRNQASKVNERVKAEIASLNKYKKACDEDLQEKIEAARIKNESINKKMITVFGKFEEYLSSVVNGKGVYKSEHDTLNDKYQTQVDIIQDPRAGLLKKLRDLQTRVRLGVIKGQKEDETPNSMRLRLEDTWSTEAGDDISVDDLKDLFEVLKKQKQGLEVLKDDINKNASQLYSIEKELNNF